MCLITELNVPIDWMDVNYDNSLAAKQAWLDNIFRRKISENA